MSEIQVEILSPSKVVTKTKATHVKVPGVDGYLGILPGHTAFITELGVGELKLEGNSPESSGDDQRFFIAGGYLEVANDRAKILVDVVERPGEIDKERAERAKQRALDRLDKNAGIDVMRAQASLVRASQRLIIVDRR